MKTVVEKIIDAMINFFDSGMTWPASWKSNFWRRTFLLTLPISLPLWLAYSLFVIMCAFVVVIIIGSVYFAILTWQGEERTENDTTSVS